MNEDERHAAATALWDSEQARAPIAPVTEQWSGVSVVDAYEIQRLNVARRQEAGALLRGHKVGLSSKVMQRMMNVDEPDYGHLLHDMFVFESDPVDAAALCAPKVEVEIAFVLKARLAGPGVTVADVLRATDFVMPSIEIIDSRIENWKLTIADTIADNASSARVVLGGNATSVIGIDLRNIGAVLWKNGEIVTSGAAGAVLGNSATSVAWLANKVHAFGITLEPGHVILPGSFTPAIDVARGDSVTAVFDRLGPVATKFE
ncbi:MAG: 2-oxopent-4-enoate hydratase [Actinomycetia bacterium]|nr:2-oxopent-4-enoate hydratase [Actinomycetes bacterium]